MLNLIKLKWRHNDVITHSIFMKFKHNRPRVYLSGIPNFILIEHKRAKIQSREVNRELWRKNGYYVTVTLTFEWLWPKVTNVNRVRARAVSNHLAKSDSKWFHLFGWNFVHKKTSDTHTDRHTHTDELQWKYNPSTSMWRCNYKKSRNDLLKRLYGV